MHFSNQHLDAKQIAQLVRGDSPADSDSIENHIETCATCRTKMENLAAQPDWWSKTQDNLSDVNLVDSAVVPGTSDVVPWGGVDFRADRAEDFKQILDAPSHPEMLGQLDRFEIERVIGRGGMGVVFKGLDRELNRAVAIKVMSPHLAHNGTARKRFEREARAAAAVVHPNVIPIHGVDSSRQHPFIVMPMIAGHSLQAYVDDHGPLDLKDVVRIGKQIASGLAAAHDQGLIHRDIKPANILMEQDISRVTITDFGLARAADDVAMTQTGWLAGTPHYMSPEQARGVPIDGRSDLFSLGSLMYFMATGREPFRAEKPVAVLHKICVEQALPVRQVNEDMTRTLSDILEKLLEKAPADRFQTASEVEQVLTEYLTYLQHPQSTKRPVRIRTRRQRNYRNRLVQTGVATTLLVALAAWGIAHWPQGETGGAKLPNQNASPLPVQSVQPLPVQSAPRADPFVLSNPAPAVLPEDEFQMELKLLATDLDSLESFLREPPLHPQLSPDTGPEQRPPAMDPAVDVQPNYFKSDFPN